MEYVYNIRTIYIDHLDNNENEITRIYIQENITGFKIIINLFSHTFDQIMYDKTQYTLNNLDKILELSVQLK